MATINLPNDRQRLTIVGATGSGKTQAAMWHLSMRAFDQMPWIIYDYKNDEMINELQGTQTLTLDQPIPNHPGVYIVHPTPDEFDAVERHMWAIWSHERVGVYVDEGYMVSDGAKVNKGFRAILTQGRSKHIPLIVLSQRPVWMDRFVFSESEYFQIFRLQSVKDQRTVGEFIPFDISQRLPEFQSYYYDVPQNRIVILGAVPDRDTILDTFEAKLEKIRKVV
jgi:hypothetical protein